MTTAPKVSVIMPTYNQSRWLPAALASIESQTFRDFRLIVVDDGSDDETGFVLAEAEVDADRPLPFRRPQRRAWLALAENGGAAEAINKGARFDGGDPFVAGVYRTWVSSDNEMTPDWLETLVPVLDAGAGVAYGAFDWSRPSEPGHRLFRAYAPDILINDLNCFVGPAFLIRADVWDEAGPHRGAISHDYDHWLRVEEVCWRRGLAIVGVDRVLCRYNAHKERATVVRAHEFDAPRWQAEARQRRGIA